MASKGLGPRPARAASTPASTSVVNPSEAKGGTLKFANAGDWDTLDPGETYYAYSWNFARLYGRSLMMFKSAPGKEGNQLVPDLAEGPGEASGDAKTWTYKLRQGVKFDDGTEVTSADVKYAILRSTDKQTFPNGPAYWEGLLDLPSGYKGPYKTPNMNTDSAIETPDKYTIVFHTKAPFAAFDYLAQQPNTMPVPKDKDTGAKYRNTIVSTGPYKFEDLQPGKSFNLVRNDQWDPATDPNRKALPDRIEVTLNVNPDDIDNRLISGDLDVDCHGPRSSTGRTEPGSAGSDPQGERGQPAQRAELVHLDQPDGGSAQQHRMPQGDHVRHGSHWLPDRIRRPVCGWGSGNDDPAAEHSRLYGFRSVPERPRPQGRSRGSEEVTGSLRAAERF